MEKPVRLQSGLSVASPTLVGPAALTLGAMVLAFLAFDDITTDNATGFRLEYTLLACTGAWLAIFVVQLCRHGRSLLAGVALFLLLASAWVTLDGVGHTREGGWRLFWREYSTITLTWLGFSVIAATLVWEGLRRRQE
jgi:hypothetical protein